MGVPMDHDAGAAGGVGQLDWLLDDLVRRVGHVTKAVILSQDGMALGASQSLGRDDAEHLAALSAGFQSLARGAERHFGNGGAVRQTIIEMESGFLSWCDRHVPVWRKLGRNEIWIRQRILIFYMASDESREIVKCIIYVIGWEV